MTSRAIEIGGVELRLMLVKERVWPSQRASRSDLWIDLNAMWVRSRNAGAETGSHHDLDKHLTTSNSFEEQFSGKNSRIPLKFYLMQHVEYSYSTIHPIG